MSCRALFAAFVLSPSYHSLAEHQPHEKTQKFVLETSAKNSPVQISNLFLCFAVFAAFDGLLIFAS
jgi:hypothetical protein